MKLPPFQKIPLQARLCWGWEIFPSAINNPPCCLLLFTPILAFLFLHQYLKTYGEQLLKISQWIQLKGLLRGSSNTLIFLLPLSMLFLLNLLTCVTSPAVKEKSSCTPDGSGYPVMNCTILPSSLPFSDQPDPLQHAQPLTAAGVWEHLVPSPALLTY